LFFLYSLFIFAKTRKYNSCVYNQTLRIMARKELIQELKIREKELIEELEAIQRILQSNIIKDSIGEEGGEGGMIRTKFPVTDKGKKSWEDYIIDVLKKIGGKGKSIEVTEAIVKANPDIPEDRISHAVRHHLSKLLKYRKIDAKKSNIKSEGYEYFIK